jgi:F0F1-type ATP synthase delta subunit
MQALDLSDFFTTKAEANVFLTCVTDISEMVFQTNFNIEKALSVQLGVTKSDKFLAIMRQNNVNPQSLPAIKDFLQLIKDTITNTPVLTLTIAFEPQVQTLKALSEWFLVNMNQQMVFDITVDTSLVAGTKITYNGKFFDFSIRPVVEKVLSNNLTRIAQAQTATQQPPAPQTHQNGNNIVVTR